MISKTMFVPELNLGFVILTNNINYLPSCLSFEILDEYIGLNSKDQIDWMKMFLDFKKADEEGMLAKAKADEDARVKDTKPSKLLEEYAGVYTSEIYGDVEVKLNGPNELTIDFKPTALFKGSLTHYHYDSFELKWTTSMMLPSGKVTFILNATGNVEEMKVFVENPDFDFTELKLLRSK